MFEVKSADNVPLTPSNVPTKFRSDRHNRFGKKYTNVISDLKNGHYYTRSRSFEVKFAGKVPLTLAMSIQSFVRITEKDWEKTAKNVINIWL